MADLTFGQLETLWIQAGGSKAVAPLMAAIALAESSGDPNSINPDDNHGTQSSYGLWQISNGTHSPPSPSWNNPRINAALAVAKYNAAGGPSPWGTYPNPALAILAAHGGQDPSALPSTIQGGSAGGSAGGGATASGSGFHFPNPLDEITGAISLAKGVGGIAASFRNIADTFGGILTDIEWLFVPSHWVRIFAGALGTGTLLTGVWALSRTGSGAGDVSLAAGIGLVTLAGILLFIAFHNLPDDVKDLQGLLGWFSHSLTEGHAAASAQG